MIGLITAVVLFNSLAFIKNRRLNKSQVIHIWLFTIALQLVVDSYIDLKYHGYWYFSKGVDWPSLPAITMLIPPVNILFLNGYPFGKPRYKQGLYFFCSLFAYFIYELLTLLPEPWGYFHYGWWNIWYSAMANPILLILLLIFYKWISKLT
ncbi:hypothetical protein JOD43_004421 [Pullulanibacillus pueri]|uniref:hypothetical protein n=1 Tax=Pullulanibacillus pueri TaxID=1437324 RepID=UPI00166AB76B|nr:hypothetical protein [Pullulanibacillus pueri]MBM7684206.1 hypothetical protein [Pullulanibacillus pueri]